MRTTLASILILAAAAIGCGGKSKSEATDPCKDPCKDKPMDGHDDGREHEAHVMTPEMTAFHDVLKPLWPAAVGPARTVQVCDQSGHLLDLANAIQIATLPEGVADEASEVAWEVGVRDLMIAITVVQDSCPAAENGVTTDDAFGQVHDAFHALLEQMPKE